MARPDTDDFYLQPWRQAVYCVVYHHGYRITVDMKLMGAVRLLLVVVTRARYGGVARCRCCHQAWDPSPVTSLSWRWRHSNGSVTLDKCAPNHPPESHCMNIYYIYYLSIMMGWQLIYHRPDLTRDQPPVPSRSNTSPLDFALDSWLFIGNKTRRKSKVPK